MLRTLRQWLILSHVLPTLIIIPLLGLALVFILETRVLLPGLASELAGQANLAAELASDHPEIWRDPTQARAFADRLGSRLNARVMLLDTQGVLLASSDPGDASRVGQRLDPAGLDWARNGQAAIRTAYGRYRTAEVADVLVPVRGSDGQVLGIIRLTHQFVSVSEQFAHLRYLIAAVLAAGLVLGAGIGLLLALNLERPLRELTSSISRLASGGHLAPLPKRGPAEIAALTQTFNTLVERLRSLESARRQLLANLVHELGRPLGALRSGVQALLGGAAEEAELRRELLVGMDEELGHLKRLLDDLARLHDHVLGSLELARRPVRLAEWLAPALVPWREAARAKGLRFEAVVPPGLPTIELDPDRAAQALGNLLDNAIKYTPAGGQVAVSAGATDDAAWIRVADTGPGIALAEQSAIFDPFYRGRAVQRYPEGMGLGLTIARDLAAAHGGRLEVRSSPGSGSEFTLWLPLTSSGSSASCRDTRTPPRPTPPVPMG